jgi:hypothetical protein
MERRNEFVARCVAIREETVRRLAVLQQDVTISEEKASTQRKAIHGWRREALGRLAHPGTLVSAKQIDAAIRMAKHVRGSAKQRFLDRVLDEAERAYDSQSAEYRVLAAHGEDLAPSDRSARVDGAEGTGEVQEARGASRSHLSTHVRLLHDNVRALASLIYHHAAKAEKRKARLRGMKGPLWRATAAEHSGVNKRRMARLEAAVKDAQM